MERAKLLGMDKGVNNGGVGVGRVGGVAATDNNMAPVEAGATAVREAMMGGGGQNLGSRRGGAGCRGYSTPEMKALAQFERKRRELDAKNTRAIFGS